MSVLLARALAIGLFPGSGDVKVCSEVAGVRRALGWRDLFALGDVEQEGPPEDLPHVCGWRPAV
jgi:hypothetical protein